MKNADFEWYLSKSREINGPHRCPFAAANLCPRYYESLYLLGEVGIATKISPESKVKLDALWKDFEATIGEEAASISGGERNSTKAMSNFCPEVSYKIFGLFASGLFPCHDETDRSMAHSGLRRAGIKSDDPRWNWADFTPAHYSECSEYSILQARGTTGKRESAIGGMVFNIGNVQGAVGHLANSPVKVVQADGKNDLKAVSPEFVGGNSGEILHKCSHCKRGFKVQNPNLIAASGTPTITCPSCGQVDQLGYWAAPE
jgi:DNA-directed RNA polymerase subunit RPC12/RpoP